MSPGLFSLPALPQVRDGSEPMAHVDPVQASCCCLLHCYLQPGGWTVSRLGASLELVMDPDSEHPFAHPFVLGGGRGGGCRRVQREPSCAGFILCLEAQIAEPDLLFEGRS